MKIEKVANGYLLHLPNLNVKDKFYVKIDETKSLLVIVEETKHVKKIKPVFKSTQKIKPETDYESTQKIKPETDYESTQKIKPDTDYESTQKITDSAEANFEITQKMSSEEIIKDIKESIASGDGREMVIAKLKFLSKYGLKDLFNNKNNMMLIVRFCSELEFEEELFNEAIFIIKDFSENLKKLYKSVDLEKEGMMLIFVLSELAFQGYCKDKEFFYKILGDIKVKKIKQNLKFLNILLLKAFSKLDEDITVHICKEEFLEKKEKLDYYEFQMVSNILKKIKGRKSYNILHGLLRSYWSSYYAKD